MTWTNSEQICIVNSKNEVVGKADRAVAREFRLPFRVVYIIVRSRSGQFYVQRRSMQKDFSAGLLNPVTSGIVQYGEDVYSAAERELFEEMGIKDVPLQRIDTFYYSEERGSIWGTLYECTYDGELVLEKEEVDDVLLMELDEILMRKAEFTADGMFALKRYLSAILT